MTQAAIRPPINAANMLGLTPSAQIVTSDTPSAVVADIGPVPAKLTNAQITGLDRNCDRGTIRLRLGSTPDSHDHSQQKGHSHESSSFPPIISPSTSPLNPPFEAFSRNLALRRCQARFLDNASNPSRNTRRIVSDIVGSPKSPISASKRSYPPLVTANVTDRTSGPKQLGRPFFLAIQTQGRGKRTKTAKTTQARWPEGQVEGLGGIYRI